MQVLLNFGETFVLEVGLDASVEEVRRLVSAKTKLPPEATMLVVHGKPLRTTTTTTTTNKKKSSCFLRDYDIQKNAQIFAVAKVCGGALLGKPVKGRSKGINFEDKFIRQREYDAQNQRYQQARNELKAKMEQEKTNSRVNRLKIQNQWRKIMRLAKVESLRKGIEILSQNHERDVDRKDAIIQMVDRDLEEAEDQFQMALRSHLQNIDALIDLQDGRLLVSEQEFEGELETLEQEFLAEKEAIVAHHAEEARELKDMMSSVDGEEQEREAEARQEHEQLREEIKNRNLEEINMLRISLDSQIEDLEQHFETAHLNYLQTTDQRTHDFKFYTKKDAEHSKDIDMKMRKIDRLQSSLQHWRTKRSQNAKECSARNQLLLDEKNKIQGHFQRLKNRMNKFRSTEARRFADLTQNAHSCKQKLNDRIDTAERILVLAELARKLETDQEKIIPNDLVDHHTEEVTAETTKASKALALEEKNDATALQTTSLTKSGEVVPDWDHLKNFLNKYNKVLLDTLAIEREKDRLQKENQDLQHILGQYFDGVSINDSVMDNQNPLFVVNGKLDILNKSLPVSQMINSPAQLDANHLVETSRVNTAYF